MRMALLDLVLVGLLLWLTIRCVWFYPQSKETQ